MEVNSAKEVPSIPGYQIFEKLGEGSMGTVYRAKQVALDREVAIKILRSSLSKEKRYLDRLQREAKLTARLDHPHVVKGIDFGVCEGRPYFVMEYAPGKTLKEILREKGRFSEAEALSVAIQVASALEHAYRNGIVHRDVKPGNIVLTQNNQVKLTDLGLARRPGDPAVTQQGSTMGTPQYISPEQARNPSDVDIRSDLYSLGATLYHLVTGSPPFAGESLADLLTKVLFERAQAASEREPSVSEGFSLVLRKMLSKDPALRYQTTADLIEDLKLVQQARAPRLAGKKFEEEKRKLSPWALGSVGLGAVALVWGLSVFLGKGSEPGQHTSISEPTEWKALEPQESMSVGQLLDIRSKLRDLAQSSPEPELVQKAQELERKAAQLFGKRLALLLDGVRAEWEQAWAQKQYLELDQFLSKGAEQRFLQFFGTSAPEVRQRSSAWIADWDQWLTAESKSFESKMQRVSESLRQETQRQLQVLRTRIPEFLRRHQYRSAFLELETGVRDFRNADGDSWESLPSRFQIHSQNAAWEKEQSDLITKSSREFTDQLLQEIEQFRDQCMEQFETGLVSSPSREFELRWAQTQKRWDFKESEMLVEHSAQLDQGLAKSRAQVLAREESVRRNAALRVIQDLDRDFQPALKQREYEKTLAEWKKIRDRAAFESFLEDIDWRVRELQALQGLRDRFAQALNQSRHETIQVKENAIWKSGKPILGFDSRTGEFVLEQTNGMRMQCNYATVHAETIGQVCGIVDPKTGQERDELGAADLYAWAVFQLYESNWTRARDLLVRWARQEGLSEKLTPVLLRISQLEKNNQLRAEQRENLAKEALDHARRLAIVGEFSRAQQKYAELLRDFSDVEFVRTKRSSFESEAQLLQESEKVALREAALRVMFPDAEIFALPEQRVHLRYSFRSELPAPWRMSDAWGVSEGCVRRKARCENASQFRALHGPRAQLLFADRAGLRVSFRVAFPYESGQPFFSVFSVFGQNFGVWSGGSASLGQIANWSGPIENYEGDFKHPGWTAVKGKELPKFRFLRGASYEIAAQFDATGKELTFSIDGEPFAQMRWAEPAQALKDRIEFRSWEAAELREVVLEGIVGEHK